MPARAGANAEFMKRFIQTILLAAALLAASSAGAKGVRTEWGVVGGILYPWSKVQTEGSDIKLASSLGYTAGVHMGVCFGKHFAIQPELNYVYTKFNAESKGMPFSANVKSHVLQLPIMASLRFSCVRLHAGPVITLLDNPTYLDSTGAKQPFGHIYPTLSYTVGVGLFFFKHLLIDVRYHGTFNSTSHALSADENRSREFKSSINNIQLKVGFLF